MTAREQSTFFEQLVGDKRIVVLKTYDAKLARNAFEEMTQDALEVLGSSLELTTKFESSDIPSPHDEGFAEFLWEILQDGAREDWDSFSFFIVEEMRQTETKALYVSSDWPSAEAYAKNAATLLT